MREGVKEKMIELLTSFSNSLIQSLNHYFLGKQELRREKAYAFFWGVRELHEFHEF
jgi:hypothetical protein